MSDGRHAEIAGAGIGGLTLATALGLQGWSVRVHERAAQLRDIGVGTTVWQNGIRVLRAVGAFDEVARHGTQIERLEILDEQERPLRVHRYNDVDDQALVVLRIDLHRALVNAALAAGAEILTSSSAEAADPNGTLILETGERLQADLVVGCDGYYSKVRDSLDLAEEFGAVTDAYIGRTTVPRTTRAANETIQDYWAGSRRLGVLSCGNAYYLFMSAPENCPYNREEVRTRTLNKDVWSTAFPSLADKIMAAESEVVWGRYPIVRCRTWSTGRAAVLGDAAHAMPPTLAQGAGCAMVNALALAAAVRNNQDIRSALIQWEMRERPVTELTQRLAVLYTALAKRWPGDLLAMRSEIIAFAFGSPDFESYFTTVTRHVVSGT
jgi:2-polyprenyl-6-methoxyphenol hydroxylase-like FAD-dependent oxidoreductase